MKRVALTLLCLCLLLTGCAPQNAVSTPEAPPEPEGSAVSNEYYPIGENQAYTWLEGGKVLAVPENNTIRYIDLNNQLLKTLTIPAEKVPEDAWMALADNRIFIAGDLQVVDLDGKPTLVNGSIWGGNGNLVRAFLSLESRYDEAQEPHTRYFLSDGREIAADAGMGSISAYGPPVWINDDFVALNAGSRLFLYRISTDTVTLVDDMSSWMDKYGKFQVYYGVHFLMPAKTGKGCYYFAHKNEEKSNAVGTVWYADETGSRVLFDGQEFSHAVYENGMLLMLDWGEDYATTRLWYATDDDLTLRELVSWDEGYSLQRAANGYIAMVGWQEPYRFYAIDTTNATLLTMPPQIENCRQYEILGVRGNGGTVQFFYTTFIDGETDGYLYDTATGINRKLESRLCLFGDEALHDPMTHFVDRTPNASYEDLRSATDLRVREIK